MKQKKKVYIHTLGCPKNEVDSEVMAGILARNGLQIVDDMDRADLILINTCTFVDDAKEESIEAILEAGAGKGKRKLLVTGCLAERYGGELLEEIPEIDGLVGALSLHKVGETARSLLGPAVCEPAAAASRVETDRISEGRLRAGPAHTAYLKIAEGCDRPCAFCSIPSFRGALNSRSPESLEIEARLLADGGVREIVLIGQETTAYGKDIGGGASLATLVDRIAPIDRIRWLRILYAYPTGIDDALIERIADGKTCRYIDVPVQHVSDSVLKRMRRGMSGREVRAVVGRLRERVPGITLRTSLLVGFPGETDEEHAEILRFVEETRFDRLGVFRYSPQEKTVGAGLDDPVPNEVALERQQQLVDAQERIQEERSRSLVGETVEVLVDGSDEEGLWARTESDAPEIDGAVLVRGSDAGPGEFLRVTITEAGGATLVAEPAEDGHG